MKRAARAVAALLLTCVACGVYAAAAEYPNRPIRFVVPFAPGGPSDILSRMVGQKLSESLGETIVVDNRGSVGGVLGAELGAKAPPDGYTILLAASSLLAIAHFKLMAGIDMVAIPYKGTGQAVIDLVAGHVQMFFMNPLVAVPNIKGGKLRGLAVTSTTRNPALPDLPTVAEAGVPGYKSTNWHSIQVPAGTPKPIVKRLHTELVKIVNLPDVQERFKSQGLTPVGSTPEELSALIKEESLEFAKLVKTIGLQPQ